MDLNKITIKEYLSQKGIDFQESGNEIITKCLFNECDRDSRPNEAHLYFSADTGQYDCKKCGEKGNIITLAKHLGDTPQKSSNQRGFNPELVEKCHQALPDHIREYLHNRGLTDEIIDQYKLGYGQFYRKQWITIPIKDIYGNYSYFKLRQDPTLGNDKITYPKSGAKAQVFDWRSLTYDTDELVICEGEMDRLLLVSKGVNAVTSTHGAMTFKEEWVKKIKKGTKVYICFDNDDAGEKGSLKVAKFVEKHGFETFIIKLPKEVENGGDVTDYFTKLEGSVEDLLGKYASPYPERIDVSKFSPMSSKELIETLGLTIKYDYENKLCTFLCELSAYTEGAQFNISYNAPSSTGKSFIPTEIARMFPQEDVLEIAYCSPTAFFHDMGEYDKATNTTKVDLSRKILIFLDQPHNDLLTRLRPLLSHDKKEIVSKITDKNQRNGMRTKNALIRGYPSVIFCTAGYNIDEQEATRFLLLSPEINSDKIQEGISATIRKESNSKDFKDWLEENPKRALLKERIRAIKLEEIEDINIESPEEIREKFLEKHKNLKPRHQRDVKRLLSLIKSFALLNVWWRERDGSTITANKDDIDEAFELWDKISVSQELNLPPYVYNLHNEVILKAWEEKDVFENGEIDGMFDEDRKRIGVSRQEVLDKHFDIYGRPLNSNQLRQQILPMLEQAGLIVQEKDKDDARKMLIFPTEPYRNKNTEKSGENKNSGKNSEETENNSEAEGGVKNKLLESDEITIDDIEGFNDIEIDDLNL